MPTTSRFPLFHYYRFVTSLLCSSLRHSLPLFLTSLYYLFKVSIVSFVYLFVTSLYYLFNVFIVSLSVCYVTALFLSSTVSSSISYVTILSLQCLHRLIICLLRH